jgi:hypothetical protein
MGDSMVDSSIQHEKSDRALRDRDTDTEADADIP